MRTSYKYKLLNKAIRAIIQELNEHPVNYEHSHVTVTCYACENQELITHETEWVLNPAAGNVNYCSEPIDTPPIETIWWADDEQWITENICAYQTADGGSTAALSQCAPLTTPINTNFQGNVQEHGWETTFECLIREKETNTGNPCNLLRRKLKNLQDKLPNVGSNQQAIIQNKIDFIETESGYLTSLLNAGGQCYQSSLDHDPGNIQGGSFDFDKLHWSTNFKTKTQDHSNPCNFLQNKIEQWQSKLDNLTTSSASYRDMLEYKIEFAEDLLDEEDCETEGGEGGL